MHGELASAASGVAWALSLMFLVSCAHKVALLRDRRAARAVPLLRGSRTLARHPAPVLAAAAVIELVLAVGLVVVPQLALAGSLALLLIYSAVLAQLEPDEPCECFGGHGASSRVALWRNLVLALVASGALGVLLTGDAGPISTLTLGVALIVIAPVAAVGALGRWVVLPTSHEER